MKIDTQVTWEERLCELISHSRIRILTIQIPLDAWLGLRTQTGYESSVYHQLGNR